jgi:hypothetical protein
MMGPEPPPAQKLLARTECILMPYGALYRLPGASYAVAFA